MNMVCQVLSAAQHDWHHLVYPNVINLYLMLLYHFYSKYKNGVQSDWADDQCVPLYASSSHSDNRRLSSTSDFDQRLGLTHFIEMSDILRLEIQ